MLTENNKISSIRKSIGIYDDTTPMSKLFDVINNYRQNGNKTVIVSTFLGSYDGAIMQDLIFWLGEERQVKISILKAPEYTDLVFIEEILSP